MTVEAGAFALISPPSDGHAFMLMHAYTKRIENFEGMTSSSDCVDNCTVLYVKFYYNL